jgi:hypothetical protein
MKNNYVKVKDHEYLVKDTKTGAILNTDLNIVRQHEMRMKQIEKEKARDEEINKIKSDVSEIKQLLQALVNKRD